MNRIAQVLLFTLAASLAWLNPVPVQAQDEFGGFSEAELDQMLAPLALYPDTVLSHVLIAATYPIEIVQAARWTRQHPDLRGETAVNAVIGQEWDPSVMALVAFPELLARMDTDLDWTQRLGDAFLIQEEAVLDSIQRLRAQAYQAGHLRSSEHVQVIREREVIYIEPPRRQVIYLPVYDTRLVYGSWAWAHYPPLFWYPPRHRAGVVVYWGPAFYVPPAFYFSSFHWSRRQVVVVHHHHHYYRPHHPRPRHVVHHHHHHAHYRGRDLARHDEARRWQHDPGHRRGVAYHPAVDERHRQLAQRSTRSDSAPPVRVAESRSDQRAWAASRRAEVRSDSLIPQSGDQARRSARPAASTRSAGSDLNPRANASVGQRSQVAPSSDRSARPALRAADSAAAPRASTGSALSEPRRAAPTSSPRAVERQLQQRSAAVPQAQTGSAAGATRQSAPPPRTGADLRAVPRAQTAAPAASRPAAPQARATQPISRSLDSRSAAPARSASPPPAATSRPPAAPVSQPRAMPPRAASPAPARAPEARPAPAPRQSAPSPAVRPQANTRTPERRSDRRID